MGKIILGLLIILILVVLGIFGKGFYDKNFGTKVNQSIVQSNTTFINQSIYQNITQEAPGTFWPSIKPIVITAMILIFLGLVVFAVYKLLSKSKTIGLKSKERCMKAGYDALQRAGMHPVCIDANKPEAKHSFRYFGGDTDSDPRWLFLFVNDMVFWRVQNVPKHGLVGIKVSQKTLESWGEETGKTFREWRQSLLAEKKVKDMQDWAGKIEKQPSVGDLLLEKGAIQPVEIEDLGEDN